MSEYNTPKVRLFGDSVTSINDIFDPKRGIYYVPMLNDCTTSFADDANRLNQLGYTGKNLKAAVLDTGVLPEHPYLKHRLAAIKDFTGHGFEDNNGHGTAVAIILAMTAPETSILIGKVFENDEAPLSDHINRIAQGVNWAIDNGATIVNMSLGIEKRKEDLCKNPEDCEAVKNVCKAIERAIKDNILVLVAAGANFPADCNESIIVVGAIDHERLSQKKSGTAYTKDIIPTACVFFDSFLVPTFVYDGYLSLSNGHYEQALGFLDEAVEKDPDHYQVWDYRGQCLCGLNQYEDAIRSFDKALTLDQSDPNVWYRKGLALRAISQYDKAIECFNKFMQIEGVGASAWTKHSESSDSNANNEEDSSYPINPELASNAWSDMGYYYEQANKFDEAAKCYDKAIRLNERNAQAYNNLGGILGKRGKYEDSIEYFDRAIEIDPSIVDSWYNKGLALTRLNRYEESIEFLDKAIEIDPTFDMASKEKKRILEKLKSNE